jgi:hypothetical protein
MIACGIGTIVQAVRVRGFGSGFLCPNLCGPNFFVASMNAAWLGGLPLMRGMTIAVALNQLLRTRQGPMPPAIAESPCRPLSGAPAPPYLGARKIMDITRHIPFSEYGRMDKDDMS